MVAGEHDVRACGVVHGPFGIVRLRFPLESDLSKAQETTKRERDCGVVVEVLLCARAGHGREVKAGSLSKDAGDRCCIFCAQRKRRW